MFCEIVVPKNFAKFTVKHLGWSHLSINLQVYTANPMANVSGTSQMTYATRKYLFWNMKVY